MPPLSLKKKEDRDLLRKLIEAFLSGHQLRRPDLPYPESHSDLTWAFYEVMENFDIVERETPQKLEFK